MSHSNPRRVGNRWVFLDGKTLPVIAGGDHSTATTTVQALTDQRARLLNEIDVILNTAKDAKRDLTDQERTDHDALVAQIEGRGGLDEQIVAAAVRDADSARFANQDSRRSTSIPVPNINVKGQYSVGAGVTRSLDDFLWATNETVRASNGVGVNPVEQVIVRGSAKEPGQAAPRLSAFKPADREVIRAFQETVAEMCLVGMMIDKDARDTKKGFQAARQLPVYKDRFGQILAALDSDTSAEGVEWIPTGIGASVHEKVRAMGKVAPLFQTIALPTAPWKWPIEGADLTAYRVAEPTSDTATKVTASTSGTVAATFDPEIFGVRSLWSKTLDVDSAVAIAGYQQRKLVQAFADAREKAIIDGDTDGTHQDSDVGASTTDARTAWDGLRKKALAQTVVTATSSSVANLLALRKGMAKWGVNPADLAYIVGVSAAHALLADSNLLTVDKFGPNATILNGQIGSIAGVPVIVSEHVREDLNASGVYDGITTTKTFNLCVNRNEWAMGTRMTLDFEINDVLYLETFQRVIVGFSREDFQSIASAATNEDTAISYNVTP